MRPHGALLVLAALANPLSAQPEIKRGCAHVVLALPTADSMVAHIAGSHCGPARLVITSVARRIPMPDGIYMPARNFAFEVAIENTSDTALRLPIEMHLDRMQTQRFGRTVSQPSNLASGEPVFWVGQSIQWPWRFKTDESGGPLLAPGAQSAPVTVMLQTQPLATGFTLAFWIDALRRPKDISVQPWQIRLPTTPLHRVPGELVEAMAFPKPQAPQVLYDEPARALQFFEIRYGDPQDCVGGCFFSSAIGVRFGAHAGWLVTHDYHGDTGHVARMRAQTFVPRQEERYLLSDSLADAIAANARLRQLGEYVLAMSIKSPFIPRERLVRLVEQRYEELGPVTRQLLDAETVRADPHLLTLLAFLPDIQAFDRGEAERQLVAQASALVADSRTSTRTLFVLVRGGYGVGSGQEPNARAIVAHPNGRNSTALLALMLPHHRWIQAPLLATIDADPDVKALLVRYTAGDYGGRESAAITSSLLGDPRTANDPHILALLAQYGQQEVRWAACRRLPEEALRCYDDSPSRAIR